MMVRTTLQWLQKSKYEGTLVLILHDNFAGYDDSAANMMIPDTEPAEVVDKWNWKVMSKMNDVWRKVAAE